MKQIKLTQNKIALVDDEDYEWLMKWKWYAYKRKHTFYAARGSRVSETGLPQKTIKMHRQILEEHGLLQPGHETDHINGDGLDNRKYNLRSVTTRQNQQNRVNGHKMSSQFPGVCWNKLVKKWQSQIKINGKRIYLGCFEKEEDAALAYIVAVKQLNEGLL